MAKKRTNQVQQQAECGITGVQASSRPDINYLGDRNYRTVFSLQEAETLFVDTGLLNKRYGEKEWQAAVTVRLYWFDGEKASCIAEKSGTVKAGKEESDVRYEEVFTPADRNGWALKEGIYKIVTEIAGICGQSDDIYLVESHAQAAEYCRILDAGIDRCCGETEEQCNARPHSFNGLDKTGLKDVRFYLMAQNLLKQEWVYEFIIRVLSGDGGTKALRRVTSGQYVKTPSGNHICFAVDLGGGADGFWTEGEYTVLVTCFEQKILAFHFSIGDKDIAYRFDREILAGGTLPEPAKRESGSGSGEGKEEILDRLYRLVGLRKVKEEITRICEYAEFVRLRQENGFSTQSPMMHLVFTGHPGTGKNTVAGMIGGLFCQLGVLSSPTVRHCSRNDLVQDGAAEEEQLVRQALAASAGGVLVVDRAGDLFQPDDANDRGIIALGMLMHILMSENPQVLVILADESDEIDTMLRALPELKKVFARQLCFEDYSPEELMEITRIKLEKRQYRFTPAAGEKFYKILKAECVAGEIDFTNGNYIDERIEDAEARMSVRLMSNDGGKYEKEDLMLIVDGDIVVEAAADPGIPLEKLKTMVGLGPLKQSLLHHLNYVYFIRERQKHGFTDVMPPLNMIFSGNPGTGKLTVAKMIGEIYHSIGVLARPGIVMQNAHNFTADSDLTPQQVAAALLEAADGGILYIGEADVLPASEYGLATLESLLSALPAEEAGEVVVILAGDPDRMNKMQEINPALKNYFPYRFPFNDYTPEELLQIALRKLKEKNYALHPRAQELFFTLIRKICDKKDKRFGNALLVEKMVGSMIRNMSVRIMSVRRERELTRQEMTTMLEADIPAGAIETPKFDRDIFNEEEIKQALEDLDRVVGQAGLKVQVRNFVELARHYSQQGVKLTTRMSLQWHFTGNSAMGKGTIARIIGHLYRAMGIVDKGHVLDFKVEKLIGLLEEEAQRMIGEALAGSDGGLLLFDEDSPKLASAPGFRERVRAILMNQVAERPGSYIIIYAEPKNMLPGLNEEPGHMGEIENVLNFEDYTKDELMLILKRRLEKEKMRFTATARQHMYSFIGMLLSTEERNHASSRLMRIVADMIVRNCLQRIAKNRKTVTQDEVISVGKQDVAMFTEPFISGLVNERKRIGFV